VAVPSQGSSPQPMGICDMKKKNQIISDMAQRFTKVNNKLNRLEKKAVDFGTGEKLFASELHTIQAIGRKQGNTVTALCNRFGVTKGAVSQIISKLEKKNYVLKQRSKNDGKEINVSLTEKGRRVFESHEKLHEKMDRELLRFMKTMSEDQLNAFLKMLAHIEKYVDGFLNK
jgi:DNA-binding MarR family transcriptional regulator